MKKIVALFTAMAFALTLGVAFAEEKAPAAPEKAPATTEKAPAKTNKTKKAKHTKKHKKEAAAPAAAPATK
ncbi:MAG TPA: hypothetical protein VMM54_11345 [Nitrospirota bacterium]|nr:hypothetical protein [Nitrospirota bacterium]